jgi:polyferredoxin
MWPKRRRAAALLQGAAILLLPFLRIRGESALRFDIPSLRLHFFGTILWIDEFYLFLLGVLFLLLLGLAVTVILGRIWCGWVCPQTVLRLLAEWPAGILPRRLRAAGTAAGLLLLSAVASLSLIGYFVPPAEALRNLSRSPVLVGFFLSQWALIYGMTGLLGTRFCRTVCPYAMMQNAVCDRETISVEYDATRGDCLQCDQCIAACPVGIDIREGEQRECIACAGCIDACIRTTDAVGIEPFVSYRGSVRRPKAYLLAGVTAVAGLVFVAAMLQKPTVAFSVQWVARADLPAANVYRYTVRNDLAQPLSLTLSVRGGRIVGGSRVEVPRWSRASGRVTVVAEDPPPEAVRFTAEGGRVRLEGTAAFP